MYPTGPGLPNGAFWLLFVIRKLQESEGQFCRNYYVTIMMSQLLRSCQCLQTAVFLRKKNV